MLKVDKVTKRFGGLEALCGVDLMIEPGEIVGLIGPNGAGKSTLFNILSGVLHPTKGQVLFKGTDITNMKPHQIAEKGLVRIFQANRLFMSLSVLENIVIACHIPAKASIIEDMLGLPSVTEREREARERATNILKLAGLEKISGEVAINLPHGYQRILGASMALATGAKLLCLDEPVTGMNIEETQFMLGFIRRMREDGVTILVIEHAMRAVMALCDRIAVLNFGRKIAEGTPDEIRSNLDVIEAYLGRSEE